MQPKHTPGRISDEEKQIIASNRLDEPLVQMALAGFLHQELRHKHKVHIPPAALEAALKDYVTAIKVLGDKVTALFNAGFRIRTD